MSLEIFKRVAELESIIKDDQLVEQIMGNLISTKEQPKFSRFKRGIKYETEFACLLSQIGTCKSVVSLNQANISRDSSIIISDLMASFYFSRDNDRTTYFNCFIEVKSTFKDYYKTTKNDFSKRKLFSDQLGMPLIYAIRYTRFNPQAFWQIIDSEFIPQSNYKVSLNDVLKISLNDLLLKDYYIMIKQSLRIIYVYNKNPIDDWWILEGVGQLVKLIIYDNNDLLYDIRDRMELIKYSMFVDCFVNDIYSNDEYEDKLILEYRLRINGRFMSDLLYALNHLPCDIEGNPMDTELLSSIDSNYKYIKREYVDSIVEELNKKRQIIGYVVMADDERRERDRKWLKEKMLLFTGKEVE